MSTPPSPALSRLLPLYASGLLLLAGLSSCLGWFAYTRHQSRMQLESDTLHLSITRVADQYLVSGDPGILRRELSLLQAPERLQGLTVTDMGGYILAGWQRPRLHQDDEWREVIRFPEDAPPELQVEYVWSSPVVPGWTLALLPGLVLMPLGLAAGSLVQWLGRSTALEVERVWRQPGQPHPSPPLPGLAPALQHMRTWREQSMETQERLRNQIQKFRLSEERAVISLRDSQAAEMVARQQVRRLRAVFQQSNHPAGFLDPSGVILDMNSAGVELSGENLQEIRGKNLMDIQAFGGSVNLAEPLRRSRLGETVQFQLEVPSRNGARVVDMSLKAVRGDNGMVELLIFEGHDISERIRAEQALQETVTQFQQSQKMEAIGRLAGGIAHDFNNLLTSILGFSNMALDQLESNHEAGSDLREVIMAATRAQNLTQKLLALSRKDVPGSQLVNLNQILREMDNLIRVTLHEDIDVLTDLDPRDCTIMADPTSLEQVIVNLAVNARDAMPRSGRLYIRTSLRQVKQKDNLPLDAKPGPYVVLAVKDTGCGMSPEIVAHAFEPFFTTKESGQGTGLGLSTVYAIVKQYGGFIDLQSKPGEGTNFELYFPSVSGVKPSPTEPVAAGQPSPLPRGTETILLVEDEEGVRRMASKMIESLGYSLIQAGDGEEGARMAEKHTGKIDLIITDVVMPNLSGPEMINRLRVSIGHIPHIYVSGFTMDKLKQHGAEDSEQLLIRKPYTREILAKRIRQTLDEQVS